ncbi:SAF domain-containing protein [Dactylosporangium sp. NPDC051485]|uniref:SAF domain-containing protein n=1 Tax=Dactylosporangium sp. NPDC051485 TaxID=3154846 RepID=UPI00341E350A
MSTINRSIVDAASAPPVAASTSLARLPRRRSLGMWALGVVLVVLGSVGAYLLVVQDGMTHPYLAVSHRVAYGAAIQDSDLAVINVNAAVGLNPIPAAQRAQVVGQHAAAELYPGTLLTQDQLTKTAVPAPGQQLIGIELKPGQLPARALKPGDAVVLVVVPPTGLAGVPDPQSSTPAAQPSSIPATVAGTSGPATNGNVRVDVAVATADGSVVAAMAAAGRIVLVVTTRS